jgi:hypothetical protein
MAKEAARVGGADHGPELNKQIRQGRVEFLAQFPSLATVEMTQRSPGVH